MKKKNYIYVWLVVIMLIISTVFSNVKTAEASTIKLKNPRKSTKTSGNSKITWDCIYYGIYPQREVIADKDGLAVMKYSKNAFIVDADLYSRLLDVTNWDKNNEAVIDGERYKRQVYANDNKYYSMRYGEVQDDGTIKYKTGGYEVTIYHYFKYEPIKWRVLQIKGNKAMLVSDQILDAKQYDYKSRMKSQKIVFSGHIKGPTRVIDLDTTWAKSDIRSWLNGYSAQENAQKKNYKKANFIDTAFSKKQKSAIYSSKRDKMEESATLIRKAKTTYDKIFLLNEAEALDGKKARENGMWAYGKCKGLYLEYCEARDAKATAYSIAQGLSEQDITYWLQVPGEMINVGMGNSIWANGMFIGRHYERKMATGVEGVRPAMYLNLNKADWTYAGTVSSTGTVKETGVAKKSQTITTAKMKNYKKRSLKKKKAVIDLKAKTSGTGKLTYKITGYPSKGKQYIMVSKAGLVTLKKGAKSGTYKIQITAAATVKYKKQTKTISIKVS